MRIPTFLCLFVLLLASTYSVGQNETPMAEKDGVRLKKVVSDTSIATGQTFSYSLYISIPAGMDGIEVRDHLPAEMIFHGISSIPPSLGTPTVITPSVGANGEVKLRWASTTTSLNGMITITVSFPNGVTCNGKEYWNYLYAKWRKKDGSDGDLETSYVRTRAIANNPWRVEKVTPGLPKISGGPCPTFRTDTTEIRYRIRVYKIAGSTGQLNLVNGVVTDTLPAGAVLVGSSACVTQLGNVLTWHIGNLSALPNLNSVDCEFTVRYPAGTTSVTNIANLMGSLGSESESCGDFTNNGQICVKIEPRVEGLFYKSVSTTGQPGCGGRYVLSVTNISTDPATLTMTDTVPSYLTINSVTSSPAGALNFTISPDRIVTGSSNTPINPGQTVALVINFTISGSTPLGTLITNCAYDTLNTILGTAAEKRCATFNTNVPAARACVWKEVCKKKAFYNIGDTLRYRLRVQNTGGVALTGGTIADVLSPNLKYIGNVTFNSALTWNVPCNPLSSNWSGVSASSSGNTVSFTLPSIAPTCQDAFYGNCGAYGSPFIPFYFIEFDVKVVDTAAIGNTPNAFTLAATGLTTTVSNTDFVNIVGNLGIRAIKEVSADGGATWASSVMSSPGATIRFRLQSNIDAGSVGLRHLSFVDLLPRNDPTDDYFALTPCDNRNSGFDITFLGSISNNPAATGFNNAGSYASVNLFNPTPFAGVLFSGCGTSSDIWNPTMNAGDRNIGYYFGNNAIGSSSPVSAVFNAKISPSSTLYTKALNSFALIGFIKYLFNTSSVPSTSFVSGLPFESETARVELQEGPQLCIENLNYEIECKDKNTAGAQQYNLFIVGYNTNSDTTTNILLSTSGGKLSPTSFPVPVGHFSLNTVFTDLPPLGGTIIVYISFYNSKGILCRDSIAVKLPKCPEKENCCTAFIHQFFNQKIEYSASRNQVFLSGDIKAGPNEIQNFGYSIVSAERKIFCDAQGKDVSQRIYGDIIYGDLDFDMYPGYSQSLDYITREIKWGKYKKCYDLMKYSFHYRATLVFPPPPTPCENCYDILKFSIRYTFTDCKCLTCDTIINYEITRKCVSDLVESEFVKANPSAPVQLPLGTMDKQTTKADIIRPTGGKMRLQK